MADFFSDLKSNIKKQKDAAESIRINPESSETERLLKTIKSLNDSVPAILEKIPSFSKLSDPQSAIEEDEKGNIDVPGIFKKKPDTEEDEVNLKKFEEQKKDIEKKVLKRIREKKKKVEGKREIKPSGYVKLANRIFSDISLSLYKGKTFQPIKQDLIHANISLLPVSYISVILLTTSIAFMISLLVFIFLLFFDFTIKTPFIIKFSGDYIVRIIKVFWVLFAIPGAAFIITYMYPSFEKNSIRIKINRELPFVVIHMSAISGSRVEPSRIFEIIMSTREYPTIEREFRKIINEINIYGYDLISALRKGAANTSSEKLSDLMNGIATTTTSGGNLQKFFEKRAQSLLFDYRLEREKFTRTAETFMDIYISVVIAAPMILMLLLMMIKISGLGISLSIQLITIIMIISVTIINIVFLSFLQVKQPEG